MKMFFGILSLLLGVSITGDAACTKCEKIRDFHRTHPSKHTFYEDYLDAKEKGEEDEYYIEESGETEEKEETEEKDEKDEKEEKSKEKES